MSRQPTHLFTQLTDRKLWYDGDSSSPPDMVTKTGANFTDALTRDIEQFNQLVPPIEQIQIKTKVTPNDFSWNIPTDYAELDLKEYVNAKLSEEVIRLGWHTEDPQVTTLVLRVIQEMSMFSLLKLTEVLRVIIYIINTLEENDVVWGIGRGSSVSSYVLYLIGVHDVDSVAYDLDITDFLKPL